MDYEKAYKEALERAKYLKENTDSVGALDISANFEYIFPEFKESEDERIRKALIRNYTNQHSSNFPTADGFTREQILAWLEKQGEQKSIEQDTEIRDLWVYIREWNDKFGRLPKDEDELASCIDYVMKRQKHSWSEKDEKILNGICMYIMCSDSPEGYTEWIDFLKSLKDRVQPQPKQVWSEDDEKKRKGIIKGLEDGMGFGWASDPFSREEYIDWLKSFKERMKGE